MAQEHFKCILMKNKECFEEDLRVFQQSFINISNKSNGCFNEVSGVVSRVFQGNFKEISRKFTGCLSIKSFNDISRLF